MKQITVVVKEPGKEAEVRSIEAKLEVFQGLVGGCIEGACVDEYMREHVLEYCKRNSVGQGFTIIDLFKLLG